MVCQSPEKETGSTLSRTSRRLVCQSPEKETGLSLSWTSRRLVCQSPEKETGSTLSRTSRISWTMCCRSYCCHSVQDYYDYLEWAGLSRTVESRCLSAVQETVLHTCRCVKTPP